jgi:hypothetical protein
MRQVGSAARRISRLISRVRAEIGAKQPDFAPYPRENSSYNDAISVRMRNAAGGKGDREKGDITNIECQRSSHFPIACQELPEPPLAACGITSTAAVTVATLSSTSPVTTTPSSRPSSTPAPGFPGTSSGDVYRLRLSAERGRPFGDDSWTRETARRLGLESTLRSRGLTAKPRVVN